MGGVFSLIFWIGLSVGTVYCCKDIKNSYDGDDWKNEYIIININELILTYINNEYINFLSFFIRFEII